jgi:hypothetical protein
MCARAGKPGSSAILADFAWPSGRPKNLRCVTVGIGRPTVLNRSSPSSTHAGPGCAGSGGTSIRHTRTVAFDVLTRHDPHRLRRRPAVNISLRLILRFLVLFLFAIVPATPAWAAAQTATSSSPGVVRGVVLDRANGSPIADVSVRLQDRTPVVATDAAGRFELREVPPGKQTLFVSIVGFILVKRTVDVIGGQTAEVTVVLSEGTGTYSETVTATAATPPSS